MLKGTYRCAVTLGFEHGTFRHSLTPSTLDPTPCPIFTFQSFSKPFFKVTAKQLTHLKSHLMSQVLGGEGSIGTYTWGRWGSNPVPGMESNTSFTTPANLLQLFIHTFTHRWQPGRTTASSSGAVRVSRLAQGHLNTPEPGVELAVFWLQPSRSIS